MYRDGEGVTQDFGEAVKWFREAAERGVAGAHHNLGVMYADGQGVERDFIEAYKWISIAIAGGMTEFKEILNLLQENMSEAQVAESVRGAELWLSQHQEKKP